MRDFFSTLTRAADGEGGGGTPTAAAPAPAAAAPPPPPPAAGAGAAPLAATPGQAPAELPAAAPDYWPEGLDATLKGTNGKASLDNLAKVVKGYRDRDASRDVPDKPEGYYNFENLGDFKIDAKTKPYFDQLPKDPAFAAMAAALHKGGVGRKTALEAYQAGLNAMAEGGLLEPLIDPEAEKALLVPDAAKNAAPAEQQQAVQRRMRENADFLKLMETSRELPADVREYAELMLFDTAKGHRFFEWMRGQVQGAAGGGLQQVAGKGGDAKAALSQEMQQLTREDPKYLEKFAALEQRYKQLHG